MSINMRVGLVVFVLNAVLCASGEYLSTKQEAEITKYLSKKIETCVVHDVESLNQCLKDITLNLKPYFPYGLRSWKVPALEPMNIKSIAISQQNSGTRLAATFSDLLVSGLSDYTLTYVKSRPEKYTFELGLRFPRLGIRGRYDIDGKVLVLNLKDHGPFTANLTDVSAKADMKFKVEGGRLRLGSCSSDFHFKSIRFHLDNLFGGSPLGETINESLNASVDDLLRDFKPAFVTEIDRIVERAFREALSHIPLATWQRAIRK